MVESAVAVNNIRNGMNLVQIEADTMRDEEVMTVQNVEGKRKGDID